MHGKTAHAGLAPEEGINAIVVAGKALAELKQGRIDSETTANVGLIRGGGATNIVPDKVEVFCEARSRDMAKLDAQTKDMVATFEKVAAANGAKAEVSVKKAYGPFVLAADSLPVITAVKAAEAAGLTPSTEATGGGSDANFFNTYGVPTAVLAVGMSKVHTTDEYIKEVHLYQTAAWMVAIIQAAAEMKK
jgi:tripeptide aminopeptidase